MLMNSSDMFKDRRKTILSMGDSRTGKTYFLKTMCKHEKMFIIDVEGGLSTAEGENFECVRVTTFKEFKDVLNWYTGAAKLAGFPDRSTKNYTMLAIDSANRLQTLLVHSIQPDGKLTQNQFGEVLATMRKLFETLESKLTTGLFVTSMAMESKDELTGRVRIYPNVVGAFKYDLTGYFDTVLYHHAKVDTKGDVKYHCQLHGDSRVVAGSRLLKLKGIKNIPCDYGTMLSLLTKED